MFHFDPDKLDTKDTVGKGQFGIVYGYKGKKDEKKWVIKQVVTSEVKIAIQQIQEIVLGFSCDHPNVVPIKGFDIALDQEAEPERWIIHVKIPRMKNTLKDLIQIRTKKKNPFSENELLSFFSDMILGLEYLHNRKIAHRDIKLSNIMIDDQDCLRYTDLGVGQYVGDDSTYTMHSAGTFVFMPPELVIADVKPKTNQLYKADMWSLGIVMLKLCLGGQHAVIDQPLSQLNKGGPREQFLSEKIAKFEGQYSHELLELIRGLLRQDANERMSIQDLKQAFESKFPGKLRDRNKEEASPESVNVAENNMPIPLVKDASKNDVTKEAGEQAEAPQIEQIKPQKSEITKMNQPEPEIAQVPSAKSQSISKVNQQKENKEREEEKEVKPEPPLRRKEETEVKPVKIKEVVQEVEERKNEKEAEAEDEGSKPKNEHEEFTEYAAKREDLEKMKKYLESKLGNKFKLQIGDNPIRLIVEPQETDELKDADLNKFIYSFKNYSASTLENLEGISLVLTSCNKLTNTGIKKIVSEITTSCKKLTFFELNLWGCARVDDDVINELSTKLGAASQLEKLGLFFNECTEISDHSIQKLAEEIKTLTELKEFKLNLENCSKVTTLSVQQLMETIGTKFGKIEVLELFFVECSGISNQDLSTLSKNFINFKYLRRLTLIFSYCSELSATAIKELSQKVSRNLREIQRFEIGLHGIDISNVKQEIEKNLKNIPNLFIHSD